MVRDRTSVGGDGRQTVEQRGDRFPGTIEINERFEGQTRGLRFDQSSVRVEEQGVERRRVGRQREPYHAGR